MPRSPGFRLPGICIGALFLLPALSALATPADHDPQATLSHQSVEPCAGVGDGVRQIAGFSRQRSPRPEHTYLAQTPPGDFARLFAPELLKHKAHSAPTFSPDGREIYWSTVCEPDEIRRIMFVRYADGRWGPPRTAPFSGRYRDDQPFVTHDGRSLYFSSKRPIPGNADPPPHIWITHRRGDHWSEPALAPPPVYAESIQWTPSLTRDGTLCYDSEGIRLATAAGSGGLESQLLPESINRSGTMNWTPFIAPDGSFILFASGREPSAGSHDIFVSYRNGDTWEEPINLGPKVNTARQERFPGLSPDGDYLFFTRHHSTPCYHDLYWIEARAVLPHLGGTSQ